MLRRLKSALSLALIMIVPLGAIPIFAEQTGTGVFAPPALGSLAYNFFAPPLLPGTDYVDPVFGETVRRLTTDHVHDDIYARNMWWSADGTRYLHRTTDGTAFADFWDVIDVATGTVTHTGIPIGALGADGGFDPVDSSALYYFSGSSIHQVTLHPNGTWTDAVYWTAPGGMPFKELGGTVNWFDASGRYMLVRYGPEPSVHLYDRLNMAAGPYANSIDATKYIETGSCLGVSPDGQFLVGYQSGPLPLGVNGSGQGVSWRLDHATRTIAAAPTAFWSLCGDHGAFVSASDGRNYMIVNDCYNQAGLWRVDITNDASNLNEAQQQALPNNKLLLAYPTWNDFGHMSAVARGPLRDWAFLSTEDGTDTFNSGTADANGNVTPWRAYRQEIIALNVVTGEIRRLAHHRSRGLATDYYSTPRLSAAWDGSVVGFASNFNQPGVVDIYAIPFASVASAASLSSLVPDTVAAGTAGLVLSVNGAGFDPTSVVLWNGAPRATTFVSPTQLQATISATDVALAGTAAVTVASSGGAPSNALTFTIAPTYALAVVKAGTGTGVVTSAPAGVTCGTSCSASFVSGTAVVLTATPATGSSLAGWSGCDLVAGAQCTVTLTASRTVTATLQLTADTTPPTVAITAPAVGATVAGSITVSATATDNVGVVGVQFKLDGANLGAALTTAPYAVSWNTTTVPNGTHTLTAVASDAAGTTATSVAVGVTVSNTTSGTGSTGGGLVAQNATWTNLVNVTASGNSLLKTSGCDGCYDAGAVSQQQLTAGDGYAQFTAGDATP
ncbi:MAG: Ig-like domain-containing protein, partial [Candidatus Rokubacteria bacterium]|nr:Ig-like domain-containing protein [Candidatus Rokubacteria bacterium]